MLGQGLALANVAKSLGAACCTEMHHLLHIAYTVEKTMPSASNNSTLTLPVDVFYTILELLYPPKSAIFAGLLLGFFSRLFPMKPSIYATVNVLLLAYDIFL